MPSRRSPSSPGTVAAADPETAIPRRTSSWARPVMPLPTDAHEMRPSGREIRRRLTSSRPIHRQGPREHHAGGQRRCAPTPGRPRPVSLQPSVSVQPEGRSQSFLRGSGPAHRSLHPADRQASTRPTRRSAALSLLAQPDVLDRLGATPHRRPWATSDGRQDGHRSRLVHAIPPRSSALNRSRNVPCVWPRCCGGKPKRTTRPRPTGTSTSAARPWIFPGRAASRSPGRGRRVARRDPDVGLPDVEAQRPIEIDRTLGGHPQGQQPRRPPAPA
jgi:hypothetical protein